jgi:Fe-S cluster assembly protein SufD
MSSAPSLIERLAPDEAWRYTPVADLVRALDGSVPAAGSVLDGSTRLDRRAVDDLVGGHDGPRLVFVNGAFTSRLSDRLSLPGVHCGGHDRLDPEPAATVMPIPERDDAFLAHNRALRVDVAVVRVEPGVRVDEVVHVVHLAQPGDARTLTYPATFVEVGAGSSIEIVETFAGFDGPSFTNASTTIVAGAGSNVSYHRLQDEAIDALHVGHVYIEQSAGSQVRATSIQTGAGIARSAIDVRLAGIDAQVALDGLYLPTGHVRHDNVVTVDHTAPGCTSTQRFKGVVDDHGRGSFGGRIIVRHGAANTDASQSNRNLLLCSTAQADTRPWLEIYADEVRCAHGATVGRLDEDALFYLRSRGIPFPDARAMLVAAFAGEVIDAITVPWLRDHVAARFAAITSKGRR